MDAGARRSLADAVTNVFADLGHFHARFSLNFVRRIGSASNSVPNSDAPRLDLVVEVQDEGPACTIGEIEASPMRNHSRDELLRWLKLAPGQRLTRELLLDKQNQLVESGRFTEVMLKPGAPDDAGKVNLRVAVRELALAPPLSARYRRTKQRCNGCANGCRTGRRAEKMRCCVWMWEFQTKPVGS